MKWSFVAEVLSEMSRASKWRQTCPPCIRERQYLAIAECNLYLLRQSGPVSYVVQQDDNAKKVAHVSISCDLSYVTNNNVFYTLNCSHQIYTHTCIPTIQSPSHSRCTFKLSISLGSFFNPLVVISFIETNYKYKRTQ